MSSPETSTHPRTPDVPLGALVHDLSVQIPELVRSELRLAQAELAQKGKRAGIGASLFGVAGLLGFFGAATLIATVVLALALVLPAWVAALIVAVVLFAAAGVAALRGKSQVAEAAPATPERAMAGIKEDIETVKGHRP
ncbi:MAG: phage holin family protein [Nocardioides sp.]